MQQEKRDKKRPTRKSAPPDDARAGVALRAKMGYNEAQWVGLLSGGREDAFFGDAKEDNVLRSTMIEQFMQDPKGTLIALLLSLPGFIMALSVHEFAHAWMANRCGDPTARLMGRMTINPARHLDPIGTLMMLVAGFGWARPVPVNPLHFRNYRRDDLLVSVAGVTMNLLMFLLSMIIMTVVTVFALSRVPAGTLQTAGTSLFRMDYYGIDSLINPVENVYYPVRDLIRRIPISHLDDPLITPVFGFVPGALYRMLGNFAITNLGLCLFNLIPLPPLDGYHVLNDVILKKNLFANPRTMQICQMALLLLVFSGLVSKGLGWVEYWVLSGAGRAALGLLGALGVV